jgi:hypothetical protein
MAGGPPPGRNLWHACMAAWNCGELGSTFPLITTPPTEMALLAAVAAEPGAAWNPCEVRHAANAARLGVAAEVVVLPALEVVVRRLATEGAFEPPHPAGSNARAASPAVSRPRTVTAAIATHVSKTGLTSESASNAGHCAGHVRMHAQDSGEEAVRGERGCDCRALRCSGW